jgi:hypothetical protein
MIQRAKGRLRIEAARRLKKRVEQNRRADYLDELDKIERNYNASIRGIKRNNKPWKPWKRRNKYKNTLRKLERDLVRLEANYGVEYSWKERMKSPYAWGGIGLLAAGIGLGLGLTLGVPDKNIELEQPREPEVKTLDEIIGNHYEVERVEVTKGLTIDGRYRGVLNVQVEHSGETYVFNIMETDPEVFECLALYFMAVKERGGTIEIPDPLYMMANGIGYPRSSGDGIKFDIQLNEDEDPVYCFEGDDVMFNFITHQLLEEYIKEKYPNGIEFDIDM